MPEFRKYMHLERFGNTEVDGIEYGKTYVFPKLDGTNSQIWLNEDGTIGCGSRNRDLSLDNDNAGFMNWAVDQNHIIDYLVKNPTHTLYGEWLVPHSLKTYEESAWRNFYVFDVFCNEVEEFLCYDNYKEFLDTFGIEYIPPIATFSSGDLEKYHKTLEKNVFKIKDGEGFGEGVVIKNYDFRNKFGRVVWAKIIANHFKETHHKAMGAPEIGGLILEEKIAEEYVTRHLVEKVFAKISLENDGWNSKLIGQLLGVVWYDLINEEIWDILKKNKNPKIDFKALNRFTILRIKKLKPELF